MLTVSAGTLQQASFDKVGEGKAYDTLYFKAGSYTINRPLKMNSGTALESDGDAILKLASKVTEKVFPTMTPILGQKTNNISNIKISNITFDGNSDNQVYPTGKAYHNFIGLRNASDIEIDNCYIHDTLGDGARLTNVKNTKFSKNKIIRCGHDAVYVDGGEDVDVRNNYVELRTNSGCRLRHVKNGYVYQNYIINKEAGKASCPGMQMECSTLNSSSSNIVIEENEIHGTFGPGIWVIGTKNTDLLAASGLTIKNNLFEKCGQMYHISGVGGIVADGWDTLSIESNTFKDCVGYGVMFGKYVNVESSGAGYFASVKNNTFTGTTKSNTVGEASGTALANLIPAKYTVAASGNVYLDNVADQYNVVEQEVTRPAYLKISGSESQISELKDKYSLYMRDDNDN